MTLGLQQVYALLDKLSDPPGKRFNTLGLDGERSAPTARNQSILAHGFAPVGESVFQKLLDVTLKLTGISEADLPAFPRL